MATQVFSDGELDRLLGFPEIGRDELFRFFTLTRTDPFIPTGKRKGHNPSLASIYRALTEHEKRRAYPEAVDQVHADFTALWPSTRHD